VPSSPPRTQSWPWIALFRWHTLSVRFGPARSATPWKFLVSCRRSPYLADVSGLIVCCTHVFPCELSPRCVPAGFGISGRLSRGTNRLRRPVEPPLPKSIGFSPPLLKGTAGDSLKRWDTLVRCWFLALIHKTRFSLTYFYDRIFLSLRSVGVPVSTSIFPKLKFFLPS